MCKPVHAFVRVLLAAVLCCCAVLAHAEEDYLAPEVAFRFSARMLNAKTVEVKYAIADGYYMYRERFAFKAAGATLGEPIIPPGKIKFDDTFQKDVETYRHEVAITLPVEASGPFTLTVTGQGCADKGLCYSPMDSEIRLSPDGGPMDTVSPARGEAADGAVNAAPDSDMGRIEASLKSGKLLTIAPLFLLLGLGLAFTPCVLPMVPIVSFIIVGEGANASRTRGFLLSLVYSLGMALVYTAFGIAAGLAGEGLSASLQNPVLLGAFALLMVVLSLAMFGVFQFQMPVALQSRLAIMSGKQSASKLFGVFAMGALSALIVGPCVAAPLAGALVYISQTKDVTVGGAALFAMAMGMSIPLLLVGASAGTLLPRAGAWMEAVKRFFGVLMLGLALWIVSPAIPAVVQMLGWALLGIGYGVYLLSQEKGRWLPRTLGILFAVVGLMQLIGAATGGRDALAPLGHLSGTSQETAFRRIRSVAELDAAIAQAQGKPVMLDFYADWCVSCKEMEKLTFSDPRVQAQFAGMLLLQADVTANNADDKALLRRFGLFGPPGIIFFGKQGEEVPRARVIGYQNADKFLQSLALAGR